MEKISIKNILVQYLFSKYLFWLAKLEKKWAEHCDA